VRGPSGHLHHGNCGDGILQQGEACDDGNKIDGDGCSADCKSNETCGNGIIDEAAGEVCDDRNTVSGDGCSADCKSTEGCGNGTVENGEQCDTAGETPVCNANCSWARCGDGIVNASASEKCDRNGDRQAGASGESATCNADCTLSSCGDGKLNITAREQCDDGSDNSENGDCLPNCQRNRCGDGFVDEAIDPNTAAPKEECDDGDANSLSGACLPDCRAAKCGDGHIQDGAEGCDSGSDSATPKTVCPYGHKDCALCSKCQTVVLHNGSYCGDGTPDYDEGEACDDGPNNGATSCNYGTQYCSICDSQCTQPIPRRGPYCGDGATTDGEACDDGNNVTEDSCPYGESSCTLCNADCSAVLNLKGDYCGDGVINGNEQCDNSVCGACHPPGTIEQCTWYTLLPQATGTITIQDTALTTGTFTLNDGVSASPLTTFEFTAGNSPQSGNVGVEIMTNTDPPTIADAPTIARRIATAITGNFTASASGDTNVVTVRNTVAGVLGNQAIAVSPSISGALVVTDMTGGVGCPQNQYCQHNQDCISNYCAPTGRNAWTCQPTN
jgi:cysteine-rich repeat protein